MDKKGNILIIDDDEDFLLILTTILSKDYSVFTAATGNEGIRIIDTHNIDVVLLDLELPDCDGIDLLHQIKSDEKLKNIPVLIITATTQSGTEIRGLNEGALDHLTKPIDPITLRLRVRNYYELKRYQDYFREMSVIDSLTGIFNRRGFDQVFHREWRKACRNKENIALAMIDIDFFKKFNDCYGHQKGDHCLRDVAPALNSVLDRPTDIATRYGGEEFAVILPETDVNGARKIAEKILARVSDLKIPHGASPISNIITLSLGVGIIKPCDRFEEFIAKTDKLLYQSKNSGRNCYTVKEIVL